jgi:heme-degrading monooxygenase HmoA
MGRMIRSVLYLTPRGGDSAAIVEFYRRHAVLEQAARQDGFLGAELQVPVEGGGDVLVTALWRDAAAYDGWVANPARAAIAPQLAELVEGDLEAGTRGAVYEVALTS